MGPIFVVLFAVADGGNVCVLVVLEVGVSSLCDFSEERCDDLGGGYGEARKI